MRGNKSKSRINLKIALLGDGGVGVTAMIQRYLYDQFPTKYVPTILEKHEVLLRVKKLQVHLEIIDTPGQMDFSEIRKANYNDLDAAMVVYDASTNSVSSLLNIKSFWVKEFLNILWIK